jgi:beta-glucosidase
MVQARANALKRAAGEPWYASAPLPNERRISDMRLAVPALALLAAAAFPADVPPPYRDPARPVDERVRDLLGRMTLEEKVDQLLAGRPLEQGVVDPSGRLHAGNFEELLRQRFRADHTITPRRMAELNNALQRYRLEKSRLGIPSLMFGEGLHGSMSYGATSFPQALALASTWDPALQKRVFTAVADEMASSGTNSALSPVLDVARDPRWGRTEETYGEDPYLVSRMGVAAIQGLQGEGPTIDRHHVLATMKHYAAHGEPESGTNTAPANFSERTLRETSFVGFRAAVTEAKVGAVMASYNEIDGVPSHVNRWLLDDVLRKEWGFEGYVMSDGGGLQMLSELHGVAADHAEAARKALPAGIDFDLSDGSVYRTLVEQVKAGTVPEALVDRAAARVLAAKFRLGLFENPYTDPAYAERVTNGPAHRALALEAAQRAIVLLKNEGHTLPLDLAKLKTIAVLGPNATDVHLGGYSRDPGRGVSPLDGIRARVGTSARVLHAKGTPITLGKQGWEGWYEDHTQLADPHAQETGIRAAVEASRRADVAIVFVGETEATNREAWSESHRGDRDSLDLLGAQDELVRRVLETGTPTVVFLINGRPLSIVHVAENAPAILEGFLLGQEGGAAIANVLFGDVNPGGKLPITFPRSVGQLPAYYNHKPSRNRSYVFTSREPLFPFGHGLSYTTFALDDVRVEPAEIQAGQAATVRVEVTNTGARAGDEVVQLYVRQRLASVTRPVKELRGFRRLHLRPGEKATVELTLGPEALALVGADMKPVVEPGLFDLMVGSSSRTTASVPLRVTARK